MQEVWTLLTALSVAAIVWAVARGELRSWVQ